MNRIEGISIFGGIAIGKISLYRKQAQTVKRTRIEDVSEEITRYENAKALASAELSALYEKALKEVGEVNAQVFEVHNMLLEDEDLNDSICTCIENQKVNAEYAVAKTGENYCELFASMEDEYFQARSVDMKDITERLVAALQGNGSNVMKGDEPVIVVAKELTPSETIQMDQDKILAFVTEIGSKHSHTAILARAMNIPALTEVALQDDWDGKMAVVDGYDGVMYIEPDEATLEMAKGKQAEVERNHKLLLELKGKETITKTGQKLNLYANIGSKEEVASVLVNDAEGIGLFRTEFLYLERQDYPTEEEQFEIYRYVAERMGKKKVIFRTLDIGADKQADYFEMEKEENPAMGYRAIRICLDRKEVFKTQLRAILRASAYGRVSVMFPMVISVEEVQEAKALLEEARKELEAAGVPVGKVEIGIMVETPAAVMISRELAREVEFFSIGTNDLTQYTLAVDRQNQKLDKIYDAHHEAVLRMIQMVVENGHKEGIWVGICGELGADLELTEKFLEMGVDELSVVPGMVLSIREKVLKC